MRIEFEKLGPTNIFIDINNNFYITICDIIGNTYKVEKNDVISIEFIEKSMPITLLGVATTNYKSSLNIKFKSKDKEILAAYTDNSKDFVENAYLKVKEWFDNTNNELYSEKEIENKEDEGGLFKKLRVKLFK